MVSVVYCPPVVFVLSFPLLMKEAQSNVRINAWKVVNCLIFEVVFCRLPTMPKSEAWLTQICFRCVSVSDVMCRSCAPSIMFVPHVLSMHHLCLPCCFHTFWFLCLKFWLHISGSTVISACASIPAMIARICCLFSGEILKEKGCSSAEYLLNKKKKMS